MAMTPMVPLLMMSNRSSVAVAKGYMVGILLCIMFGVFSYFVRPLILPRHGTWHADRYGEDYVFDGKIDGRIDYSEYDGSYGAYADPPIWAGVGNYEKYTSKDKAKQQVEKWCK